MRNVHHAPQDPVGPVLAHVAGGSPASGAYRYYTLDHLGSTSGLYDGAKAKVAALAYTPYGASYGDVGPAPLPRYTGHLWDGAAGLHLAPYRAYAPTLARWLSRDPLGMVDGPNVYGYVRQSPVNRVDPTGKVSLCAVIMAVIYMTLLASKPINDKHKHCMVTCEIADSCGHADADLVGEYNELLDEIMMRLGLQNNGAEEADRKANQAGLSCAKPCSDGGGDCGQCCAESGYPP